MCSVSFILIEEFQRFLTFLFEYGIGCIIGLILRL